MKGDKEEVWQVMMMTAITMGNGRRRLTTSLVGKYRQQPPPWQCRVIFKALLNHDYL
jgi:hypothetical protein